MALYRSRAQENSERPSESGASFPVARNLKRYGPGRFAPNQGAVAPEQSSVCVQPANGSAMMVSGLAGMPEGMFNCPDPRCQIAYSCSTSASTADRACQL